MATRHERALAVAQQAGAEAVLATHVSSVAWLTGFAAEIETGPNPFVLPPLALITADARPLLIVSEDDAHVAQELGCDVVTYKGFTIEPLRPLVHAHRALIHAVGNRRVATEPGSLPFALTPGLDWVDAAAALAHERMLKDPDEIAKLRAAVALAGVGQKAVRQYAIAGASELDVWAGVRAAIERAAGGRIPLLADVISGPRTVEVGGPPSSRVLQEGDLLLVDLVPRYAGYWGDSCTTIFIGEPTTAIRAKHQKVSDALERAIEAIRPGAVAGDIDELIRRELQYPHHTGHGLGTAYHEAPRIVPDVSTILEPGMVIALEPGLYSDGEGIRLEKVVLITDTGCEILSQYDIAL